MMNKKGFTLLEVLIAVAIVGGTVITLLYTLNYHLGILQRQLDTTRATFEAEAVLQDIITTGRLPSYGDFLTIKKKDYTYIVTLEKAPVEGFAIVAVNVAEPSLQIQLKRLIRR